MQNKPSCAAIAVWMLSSVLAAYPFPAACQTSKTLPRTWDEQALDTGTLPPPVPGATVKHVSADYYYRIPERIIYKTYPLYAEKREPAGYLEKLAQTDPEVAVEEDKLHSEQDWVPAGRLVFRYPVVLLPVRVLTVWRAILEGTGISPARDGTYPQIHLVVPKKGIVMAGFLSCATCHTRIQSDGEVIEGGQGTISTLLLGGSSPDLRATRAQVRALFRVPWIQDDPIDRIATMSLDEINALSAAIPVGVVARHGTSLFTPVQVPSLIGVRERRYLDHTGLLRHRDIGDMMRYAALNQLGDLLSAYSGYRPTAALGRGFKDDELPPPERLERYSDAQLFALAEYLYSLMPPPNPNLPSDLTRKGEKVFTREGCAHCHIPPLYASNKLTPAQGFRIPVGQRRAYDIEPTIVGTQTDLTMRTRRATGYYKIPSLLGVWYRGAFEHSGSVATLEDWFDPARLRSDYVPTGFRGYGIAHRAVPGHPFGLNLSPGDKVALIAFLKTL